MKHIARIYNDFNEKFGMPRQSGILDTESRIIFNEEYRDINSLRGLLEFSHIWLLWEFSKAKREKWSPTVRPPLLGGNKRMGVFATRSPFRPNPIGLSLVKLLKIENDGNSGPVIYVSGADLINETPIYDIKPYLPYADSIPDAKAGFTESLGERQIKVTLCDSFSSEIPLEKLDEIKKILSNDPRPSYQKSEEKIYKMSYGEFETEFKLKDSSLEIINVKKRIQE